MAHLKKFQNCKLTHNLNFYLKSLLILFKDQVLLRKFHVFTGCLKSLTQEEGIVVYEKSQNVKNVMQDLKLYNLG